MKKFFSKIIREDYYDDEYILNEQEFKGSSSHLLKELQLLIIELNFVQFDPYWKIRATCYHLAIGCFGDKETLIKSIEQLLFKNYLHNRPSNSAARDLALTDIETMTKNLNAFAKKHDKVTLRDLEAHYDSRKKPILSSYFITWPPYNKT